MCIEVIAKKGRGSIFLDSDHLAAFVVTTAWADMMTELGFATIAARDQIGTLKVKVRAALVTFALRGAFLRVTHRWSLLYRVLKVIF